MALHDGPVFVEKEANWRLPDRAFFVFGVVPCVGANFWKQVNMQDLLVVYIAYAIAAGSPGPSNMAIMNVAMRQGRRPALAFAAGVITMSTCWGLVVVTGISTLLV
ncbi:LysE family translocator, partial [Rhizobium ruizarguesonis]